MRHLEFDGQRFFVERTTTKLREVGTARRAEATGEGRPRGRRRTCAGTSLRPSGRADGACRGLGGRIRRWRGAFRRARRHGGTPGRGCGPRRAGRASRRGRVGPSGRYRASPRGWRASRRPRRNSGHGSAHGRRRGRAPRDARGAPRASAGARVHLAHEPFGGALQRDARAVRGLQALGHARQRREHHVVPLRRRANGASGVLVHEPLDGLLREQHAPGGNGELARECAERAERARALRRRQDRRRPLQAVRARELDIFPNLLGRLAAAAGGGGVRAAPPRAAARRRRGRAMGRSIWRC